MLAPRKAQVAGRVVGAPEFLVLLFLAGLCAVSTLHAAFAIRASTVLAVFVRVVGVHLHGVPGSLRLLRVLSSGGLLIGGSIFGFGFCRFRKCALW